MYLEKNLYNYIEVPFIQSKIEKSENKVQYAKICMRCKEKLLWEYPSKAVFLVVGIKFTKS